MTNKFTDAGNLRTILLVLLLGFTGDLWAGDIEVNVSDTRGRTTPYAVVILHPLFDADWSSLVPQNSAMKQKNVMFSPFVLAVHKNTPVSFPNMDQFRHQVYSYSQAKQFELRLYGMDESKQVIFDTAGVVALGCNIHDNMLAYIYVADDPYYVVTDTSGVALIPAVIPGQYEMTVWHPDQKKRRESHKQNIEISADNANIEVRIALRTIRRKQKQPRSNEYSE